MSQKIGLGQLRNSAAYYFDRVAAGESFDVVRRGRMVAQIVPLTDPVLGDLGDLDVDRHGE
jgi:antitoxin (DNA-binding transcriptional repressor) of toxin-antitoxin stability system